MTYSPDITTAAAEYVCGMLQTYPCTERVRLATATVDDIVAACERCMDLATDPESEESMRLIRSGELLEEPLLMHVWRIVQDARESTHRRLLETLPVGTPTGLFDRRSWPRGAAARGATDEVGTAFAGPVQAAERRDYGADRSITIQTRVSAEERDAWDAAAGRAGVSRSEWLRAVANGAAE